MYRYVDDVVTLSKIMDEHATHANGGSWLSEHQLKLKISRCEISKKVMKLLGHISWSNNVVFDPKKVIAVHDNQAPSDEISLRSVLGLVGYYKRFIETFRRCLLYSTMPIQGPQTFNEQLHARSVRRVEKKVQQCSSIDASSFWP